MKNNIVFVGEQNRINNELYQLLNWRYKVFYCNMIDDLFWNELNTSVPALVVVSLIGNAIDYNRLFKKMTEKYANISVITVGTRTESDVYESFYEKEQFHKILRPVTGKKILEICKAVVEGEAYTEEAEQTPVSEEKQHILVVDDNAMVLRSIKGVLGERYSVAVAPSGIHAFASIGKKMPDLILLDYEMPEMNGKEVMEKLQAEDEWKDIPIMFLTSVDSKEIVMELLALKPIGYILKPVESQMLLDRIEEIIGK